MAPHCSFIPYSTGAYGSLREGNQGCPKSSPQNFGYELSVNKKKKAELHTIIDSAKPDIILGNESWLTPDIKNSEIFPESFDAVRKDRASDAHGGVFIAFKRDLLCTETPELDTNCEIVWCKMNIIGCRTLYLGSFYRPPDKIDNDYLEEFNSSLFRIMSTGNAHVLVGGDFNCGDIEWSHIKVPQGVQKGSLSNNFWTL